MSIMSTARAGVAAAAVAALAQASGAALPTENPFASIRLPDKSFFHLIPQAGVTHHLTECADHNAIWDMAVSPEGRVFFGACGESYTSVYARMYEFDPVKRKLTRHFDLEKRLSIDSVGLRTSKFHTSMSFLGGHRMLLTTHTTSPSPRHPMWMPYEYFNHAFENFKGSDLMIFDYETGETKGLGKFTSHDTIYGATYDPRNGDYFGISCLRGRGYVYNVHDGSVRCLGQVTDSRSSRCFLCSDGHLYGSSFTGAMFRYNTEKRDIEYLGVSATGLLRQAQEVDGVLYFCTGTCGVRDRGQELFGYELATGKLTNHGRMVPKPDTDWPEATGPQYQAYGLCFDGQKRMWYTCQAVTPHVRFAGAKLYMWDFLRGKAPVDCGFLGTPLRTASLVAEMRVVGNLLIATDGNHTSDRDTPCGLIAIDLEKFVPALQDPSSPRLMTHDYVNYLPYPAESFAWYPKDDFAECFERYVKYDREVVQRFRRFVKENAFRISAEGASGLSVWERVGRENAAVTAIEWTSPTELSFWCGERRGWRADCVIGDDGRAHVRAVTEAPTRRFEAIAAAVPDVALPCVPGRRYVAKPSASVKLADGGVLVGTADGMLAVVDGVKVRSEGGLMTNGPVRALTTGPDGTAWGISAHDQGVGYVFSYRRESGTALLGLPPDVKADNGRNIHIYQPTAIAVSPDGRFVAVGGSDELGGVAVFPAGAAK